ncbi:MAG: PQQ-dependent dehydrogenase, methanol/ethanol family [Blastocatellia bacterium]
MTPRKYGIGMMCLLCLVVGWRASAQQNQAAFIEQGSKLFAPTCASGYCHGPNGKDGSAPALQGRSFTTEYLTRVISDGVSGTPMPAFKNQLSAPQIQQLVAYVMSLPKGNAPAAAAPAAVARRGGADDQATTSLPMPAMKEVTGERLAAAAKEPQNWMSYFGTYDGQRYSTLEQINRTNVKQLAPVWAFQTGKIEGGLNAAPLVVDGVMYLVGSYNRVFALDAVTGRQFWHYFYKVPTGAIPYGVSVRGIAVGYGLVFMGTLDNHLVALDAKTGREVWNIEIENYQQCGCNVTAAPIVVKDKVIVGVTGGDSAHRGYLSAYNARTGKLEWRFYTIPGAGEPGVETWKGESWKYGGGATWMTGTYDPELNLVYWGVGNPASDFYSADREGTNLYTGCVVALDADTGKLKWHFQFTPHDVYDWDANQVPVLFDASFKGQSRKLVAQANRNAFYYVLDRVTGEFLCGTPYIKQTWAKGLDDKGRPIKLPNTEPTPEGTLLYPGLGGATNWYSPSYSPQTKLFYVLARENHPQYFFKSTANYHPGDLFEGGGGRDIAGLEPYGVVKALDATTGKQQWEFQLQAPAMAGLMATAGGLVFGGSSEGYFYALDARTGQPLWHFMAGAQIVTNPVSFLIRGKQYVAITAGLSLFVFALEN